MTSYTVTYIEAKGGGEVSTFVEASGVDRDPHWVTFYREWQQDQPPPLCPNCTPPGGTRRSASVTRRQTVALFPTNRIRSVVVSSNEQA